jgi:hypothetical protein
MIYMKEKVLGILTILGVAISGTVLAMSIFLNTTVLSSGSDLPIRNITAEVVSAEVVARMSIDEQRRYSSECVFSTDKSYYVKIHSRVDRRIVWVAIGTLFMACVGIFLSIRDIRKLEGHQ